MRFTKSDKERLVAEIRYAANAKKTYKIVFTVADENHVLPLLSWLYLEYGIVGAESCRSAMKKIEAKTKEYPTEGKGNGRN